MVFCLQSFISVKYSAISVVGNVIFSVFVVPEYLIQLLLSSIPQFYMFQKTHSTRFMFSGILLPWKVCSVSRHAVPRSVGTRQGSVFVRDSYCVDFMKSSYFLGTNVKKSSRSSLACNYLKFALYSYTKTNNGPTTDSEEDHALSFFDEYKRFNHAPPSRGETQTPKTTFL